MTHILPLILILLMQRVETQSGVHGVWYLETTQKPHISVASGAMAPPTSVQDSATAQWRTTVAARLDVCRGVLWADGEAIARQRCVWLPEVGK